MKSQALIPACLLLALVGGDHPAYGIQTPLSPAVSSVIYPGPPGESPSLLYEVQVAYQGAMRNSFVYSDAARQVTTPGNHGMDLQKGRSFNWTTFEIDRPTAVRVTRLRVAFNSVKLRPTRYGLRARTITRNTIEFTILPKQKVSIEFDIDMAKCYYDRVDCVRDILLIFADQKDTESPIASYSAGDIYRPAPGNYASTATIAGISAPVVSTLGNAENKKVVVFGPGVYTIGYWEVPNNVEHIHIEGGAIVYGAINVLPQGPAPAADDYLNKAFQFTLRNSFKLTGHGILSGRKIPWHMTQDFKYCPEDMCGWWKIARLVRLNVANITVTDVTLANSPNWNISLANDADSRTTGLLRGFKVVAEWAFQSDGTVSPKDGRIEDCFIQSYDDSIKLTQSGANVERCVIWQFGNGANFQIGWYPKSISNVRVKDIDVIHSENWWGRNDNSGLLSYTPGPGNGLIQDLSFTNINLEDKVLRLVGLFPESGLKIDRVSFTNINVDAWGNDAFASGRFNILNASNGGSISNLTFNGLRVGGQPVTNSNYPTRGRFQLSGNTSNIVFKP
jgi:hypothetical protein